MQSENEAHEQHNGPNNHPHIFVNRMRFGFEKGVAEEMSIEAIANFVGMTSENSIVRRVHGHDSTEPLEGVQEILNGDHFSVTRRVVRGGYIDRVQQELARLREGCQEVDLVQAHDGQFCVIYKTLQSNGTIKIKTDVLVQVPNGFPAAPIDMAALPADCPLIGRVEGSPQGLVEAGGRSWRLISYHPHNGGGAPPWDMSNHGFHTYLAEILSWLEVRK